MQNDTLLCKTRLHIDSRDSALDHISELRIPLRVGNNNAQDIEGDLYDLMQEPRWSKERNDIILFKNGAGAHLDLMIAIAIYKRKEVTSK